jgi:hypothetical protein
MNFIRKTIKGNNISYRKVKQYEERKKSLKKYKKPGKVKIYEDELYG